MKKLLAVAILCVALVSVSGIGHSRVAEYVPIGPSAPVNPLIAEYVPIGPSSAYFKA